MEVKEPVQTPKVFSLEIENIVKEKKITHMEAVLWYCDQEGIEPDTVGYLIQSPVAYALVRVATELLRHHSGVLPFP